MSGSDDPDNASYARVGTAGWTLPRAEQIHFPAGSSHLERYALRFGAVEINSSFHRSHRPAIWQRWADAVPPDFRFSVKIPKAITHVARLEKPELITAFLEECGVLRAKLGCVLVQLPPSLAFDARTAGRFFENLRTATPVRVACEPRHESWFHPEPDAFLAELHIARVAADPPRVPAGAEPGGWRGFSYYRLHGSPRIYYSAYTPEFLATLTRPLTQELEAARAVWCIFDNTTLGAATHNALDLCEALEVASKD